MKKFTICKASILPLAVIASVHAHSAELATSFGEAIRGGNTEINFRYRFEGVDQEGFLEDAKASTLRTRLTYRSLAYNDFSALIEFDNLTEIGSDDYNDTFNGKTNLPTVADPTYTEVNQAYLDFSGINGTLVRFGRQRVNLDNERFVGGVGWRQNEQTYDAFTVINSSLPDTSILLSNITNVNTILGTNINGSDHQLVHIRNTSVPFLNVSAYGYLLNEISDTYGIRLTNGNDSGNLLYTLEYADQETDTVADNSAEYLLLEGGMKLSSVTAKLSYEKLGSDAGAYGFQTPLATKHAFNGWADKFLVTPDSGLVDRYLSLSTESLGANFKIVYHDFESDEGGVDLGSEIDLAVKKNLDENLSVLLKYAKYDGGDDTSIKDTEKFWLMLNAKF